MTIKVNEAQPSLANDSSLKDNLLTDAEVDAFLEEHANDPVDEASADRIEWLFRRKLADAALADGREWLRSYQEDLVEKGQRIKHDTELLYGGTKLLIEKMVRAIETLALKPLPIIQPTASASAQTPESHHADVANGAEPAHITLNRPLT